MKTNNISKATGNFLETETIRPFNCRARRVCFLLIYNFIFIRFIIFMIARTYKIYAFLNFNHFAATFLDRIDFSEPSSALPKRKLSNIKRESKILIRHSSSTPSIPKPQVEIILEESRRGGEKSHFTIE